MDGRTLRNRLRAAAFAVACIAVAGCSGKDPRFKEVFPAHGTVTHRGQPAEGVQLNFAPEAGGPDATFATATTGAGGTFTLSTYRKGDGAPPGTYIVTAYWPDNRPTAKRTKAAAGEELLPDKFGNAYANPATSKLRATIEKKDNTLTIDIP